MKYISIPQEVSAFQFPEEASIQFVDTDKGRTDFVLEKGYWLVFFPSGERRVYDNKTFLREFTPSPSSDIPNTPKAILKRRPRGPRKVKGGLKEPVLQTSEDDIPF